MKRLHAVALSCVIGLLTTSCGRDEEIQNMVREIFGEYPTAETYVGNENGGKFVFLPSADEFSLDRVLKSIGVSTDVDFDTAALPVFSKGCINYTHKQKDGRDIYYFINTTDKPVSTEVTLRGKVFRPEFWNPHDGSITKIGNAEYAVNPTDGIWRTRIRLELAPSRSVFIVSGNYPLKNMFQQSIT